MRVLKWAARPATLLCLAIAVVLGALGYSLVVQYWKAAAEEHRARGARARERGNRDAALAELDAAVRLDPLNTAARRERGRLRLEACRPEDAVADLDAALAASAADVETLLLRADALHERGLHLDRRDDFTRATDDASAALRLDPSCARAYGIRARARAACKNFDDALADAEEAIRRAPDDTGSFYARGKVRSARGEYEGAVADLTEAVRLAPSFARAYLARGEVRLDLRDDKGALADCDRAVDLAPHDSWTYLSRADVHADAERDPQELADLDRALELNPRNAVGYALRALAHLKAYDTVKARADAGAALAINPDGPMALVALALAHFAVGRRTSGWEALDRAVRLAPDARVVYVTRAFIRQHERKYAEALADCDRVLKLGPRKTSRLDCLRVVCRLDLGDVGRAVDDCDRALARRPKDPALLALRSVARARAGALAEARADFNTAVELDHRRAYAVRAEFFLVHDEPQQAFADFTQLLLRKPNDASALLGRAEASFSKQVDRNKEGVEDCERARALLPQSYEVYLLLSLGRSLTGDHRAALAEARRALELDGENVLAHVAVAQAYLDMQEPAKAVEAATKALELEPREATAYAVRGCAYAEQHQHDKATPELEKAARLDKRFAGLKTAHDQQVAAEKQQRVPAPAPFKIDLSQFEPSKAKVENAKPADSNWLFWALGGGAVAFVVAIAAGYAHSRSRP